MKSMNKLSVSEQKVLDAIVKRHLDDYERCVKKEKVLKPKGPYKKKGLSFGKAKYKENQNELE